MANATNTENKVTVAQKFDMVIKALTEAEVTEIEGVNLIEFIEDRKVKAQKKSTSKADTEKAKANAELKDRIVEVMGDKSMRVGDIVKALDEDVTSSKVTRMLTEMKDSGIVTRTVDKKVAYYTVA